MSIGIYKITSPSGKFYVGLTIDSFESRWNGHLKELKNGRHKCQGLKAAFAKYGWDNLTVNIVESWEKPSSRKELLDLESLILQREQFWWDLFVANGEKPYHGRPTGTGSVHHTEETRLKLSLANSKKLILSESERSKIEVLITESKSRSELIEKSGMSVAQLKRRGFTIPVYSFSEIFSKELLEKEYVRNKKTTTQIASEYKVTHPTVLKYLKQFEIPARNRGGN